MKILRARFKKRARKNRSERYERNSSMIKQFIETGRIVGTHGIKGEMRLEVWADGPEYLSGIKKLYFDEKGSAPADVAAVRPHKNICILKIKGIDTIEQAETLRGRVVYINRDDRPLEKGRYYISDLIDCAVYHAETGELLGKITDVSATGANDVWHIERNGHEYLIPNIPDVVKDVCPERGEVRIIPLKGLFDDED